MKSKRIRTVPDVFGNERLEIKLDDILRDHDFRLRMYVYRMRDGLKLKPAILICAPFPNLFDHLRDEHGGGDFAIIIRRAKTIELCGVVRIAPPPHRCR
jgi:hypothetical protein